jgi:initiation factor 1A
MLGNGRLEAQCFDGEKRLAHIRGKMRKKVWINQGDIILVSLREFQDAKGDVILKYTADEARSLKAYGELPETAKINETDTYPGDGDEEVAFDFDIEDVRFPRSNDSDEFRFSFGFGVLEVEGRCIRSVKWAVRNHVENRTQCILQPLLSMMALGVELRPASVP